MQDPKYARPRVGVPWRTAAEETTGGRSKTDLYLKAVKRAGGAAVLLSLAGPLPELKQRAAELDAFVLPGSPADVSPAYFHAARHPASAQADLARERADFTLLEHALAVRKPVLAICYGIQSLNVFLGGSLVQDIPSELGSAICHRSPGDGPSGSAVIPDANHDAAFEDGLVRGMAGASHARVNSSHHQSILDPGRGLRVTGRAPDGVIEAVESMDSSLWIVGVQWHPERMQEDSLAQALFAGLVSAAQKERAAK